MRGSMWRAYSCSKKALTQFLILTQRVDFKGQRETDSYDSFGRLQGKQWFAAGSFFAGDSVTYHYDSLGRMDHYNDARGQTNYTFDLEGRTTQVAAPEG